MKFNRKYIQISFAFCSLFLLICFTGCIKKDPVSHITQVSMAPLSPTYSATTSGPAVDFVINGVIYATTVGYSTTAGTIRYTLPYYTLEPKAGSVISYNLTGTNTVLASVTKDLEEDKVYSSFLIDSVNKAKAVIVTDNLNDPTPGKVKIRFFHFSPNTVPIDVIIQATSAKLYTNRSFNDQVTNTSYENFIEIDPGTYTFLFNNTSTGANIYTTSAQTLLPDRIYTLAIRGLTGGTGFQAIGGWLYPNKP